MELTTTGVAAGGDAIARDDDGRVVFVDGALPSERVAVDITEARRDYAKGVVVEVLDASPFRRAPSCPSVAAGCGGCQWQHIDPVAQLRLKTDIAVDAMRRIARVPDPPIEGATAVPPTGYRTTLRLAVDDGRAGYRRRRSHVTEPVVCCAVAHPLLEELAVEGRFGSAEEVLLRVGARTGERLVLARPTRAGVVVPDDVLVVGEDELRRGRACAIHEEVGGRRWRVSAKSFFQSGPEAAEAIIAAVGAAAGDALAPGGALVDAYAGVGVIGGALASGMRGGSRADGVALTSIESSRSSVADARVNLRDLDATVLKVDVERWRAAPGATSVVVADPARAGLGRAAVEALTAASPEVFVLVSCDPAAAARDTALLRDAGYDLRGIRVIDTFPHTFHLELVIGYVQRAPRWVSSAS